MRAVRFDMGVDGQPGKSFSNVRVRFRVQMDDGGEPNSAKLDVWNLAEDTIATAQEDGAIIRLSAGYQVPQLLFTGNPISGGVKMERAGPDRILRIEAEDGGAEIHAAYLTKTFAPEVSLAQILDELKVTIGLPLNLVTQLPDKRFPNGITLSGDANTILDRIAAMAESTWTIRDRTIVIMPTDADSGESAVVFSATTGNLIGAPSPTDDGVELKGLLAPTLRPGKPFRVESDLVTGNYRATEVVFVGDTHGNDWYAKVKGTPL